MFKDIYILLDWMNNEERDEIFKFNYLIEAQSTDEIIDSFYSKENTSEENDKKMWLTTSLEYFMFVYYLKSKWYKKSQIKVLFDPSLLIFNDKLYQITADKIVYLSIYKVWFFSLRWINWQHPFFFLLKTLIGLKWGKASKANDLNMNMMTTRWKFHALNSLYKRRSKYIWDIIMIHEIKSSQYDILRKFISDNMWNNILIKKDFRSCWNWNYPVDLKKFDDSQKKKFDIAIVRNAIKYEAVYIVPIEEFIEEFRIYFTKVKWKIKIHSIKKKITNTTIEDILKMEVFKYWWMFKWGYVTNKERKTTYKKEYKLSIKLLKNLDYTNWILEFWKTVDWRYIFFEVNGMWAVMPYKWEDIENIRKYYDWIFENFFI